MRRSQMLLKGTSSWPPTDLIIRGVRCPRERPRSRSASGNQRPRSVEQCAVEGPVLSSFPVSSQPTFLYVDVCISVSPPQGCSQRLVGLTPSALESWAGLCSCVEQSHWTPVTLGGGASVTCEPQALPFLSGFSRPSPTSPGPSS